MSANLALVSSESTTGNSWLACDDDVLRTYLGKQLEVFDGSGYLCGVDSNHNKSMKFLFSMPRNLKEFKERLVLAINAAAAHPDGAIVDSVSKGVRDSLILSIKDGLTVEQISLRYIRKINQAL